MDDKYPVVAMTILMGVAIVSQGCQSDLLPVISNISGAHLSQDAGIHGDEKGIQAIMSVFKQAEEAVHHKDLDALMALYSEHYSHGGYTKDSIRAVWSDLFEHYHEFSSRHIFSAIKVGARNTQPIAHVTCTGSLWAMSNETGQRVMIDIWHGEVHHLIFENVTWHLAGTLGEIPRAKESDPTSRPHPFF